MKLSGTSHFGSATDGRRRDAIEGIRRRLHRGGARGQTTEGGGGTAGKSHVEFKLDGRTSELELARDDVGILEAALEVRSDLPFACRGGVCGTCRAKLVEGTVEMDVNYALEPEEIENGYVLTCQSHPTSDRVVVDYDA